MVNIISYFDKEVPAVLKQVNDSFAYVFLKQYHEFEAEQGAKLQFAVDDAGHLMPFKIFKNHKLRLLQILFPVVNAQGQRLSAEEEKIFLTEFDNFLTSKDYCDRVVQPYLVEPFFSFPDGATYCQFGTYYIDLHQTEEEIYAKFHKKYRQYINRLLKESSDKVSNKRGAGEVALFYKYMKDTYDAEGLYLQGQNYYQRFFNHLQPDNILCDVIYFEDRPQEVEMKPFTKYGCFSLYGTMAEKPIEKGIVQLINWQIIKTLKEKGIDRYYLGGVRFANVENTKYKEIQDFKRRFGGDLIKGYLWKKDINKMKCIVHDLLLLGYRLMKFKKKHLDIIDFERKAPLQHEPQEESAA